MNFEECLKKHFPLGYQTHSVLSELTNTSIEKYTLTLLKNYDGSYDLEDTLLAALIIHIRFGNIRGHNINLLLKKLNWNSNFEYDVKHNLINYKTKKMNKYHLEDDNEIGKYDYDDNDNISIDGGYDRSGYNRDGYDEEGYDELGYQEDY